MAQITEKIELGKSLASNIYDLVDEDLEDYPEHILKIQRTLKSRLKDCGLASSNATAVLDNDGKIILNENIVMGIFKCLTNRKLNISTKICKEFWLLMMTDETGGLDDERMAWTQRTVGWSVEEHAYAAVGFMRKILADYFIDSEISSHTQALNISQSLTHVKVISHSNVTPVSAARDILPVDVSVQQVATDESNVNNGTCEEAAPVLDVEDSTGVEEMALVPPIAAVIARQYLRDGEETTSSSSVIATVVTQPPAVDVWTVRSGGPTIRIVSGDIVAQGTDIVVNAANNQLAHGTGVAGRIRDAGGALLVKESNQWVKVHGALRDGCVAVTTAGNIRGASKVVHAVGPRVTGHTPSDEDCRLLESALLAVLYAAQGQNGTSISVPALSTGVFGFPMKPAAQILVNAAVLFCIDNPDSCLKEIRFVLWDEVGLATQKPSAIFRRVLGQLRAAGEGQKFLNPPQLMKDDDAAKVSTTTSSGVKTTQGETLRSDVYIANPLSTAEATGFKAAGVLMYRLCKGTLMIFLGAEHRLGEGSGVSLNLPGGMRSGSETPIQTASREFWEETGKLESCSYLHGLLNGATQVWFGPGKYMLYLLRCPDKLLDLDERYNTTPAYRRSFDAEMEKLMWVKWDDLVNCTLKHSSSVNLTRADSSVAAEYIVRSWRQTFTYALSEFLRKVLSSSVVVKAVYEASFTNLVPHLQREILKELTLIQSEVREGSVKSPLVNKSWQLKLKLPTVAPIAVSPITLLKPSEPLYRSILAQLPPSHQSKVNSIRKVDVGIRAAEYRKENDRIRNNKTDNTVAKAQPQFVREIAPTFHGTPERWRSTNIAFKGFDLGITLHGRACGNGVYSATNINTALGYISSGGSILQLRGLLTSDDHSGDPVFVFRGVKQVLVEAIIDFSPVSGNENDVEQQSEAQEKQREQAKEQLAERQREIAEMATKEKAYLKEYEQRFHSSQSYYMDFVKDIDRQLTQALLQTASSVAATNSEDQQRVVVGLWRKLEGERRQFRLAPGSDISPIYAGKGDLLRAIAAHDVVIVSAATGSGKSTQLPQYLVDDIFPATELRRVAVLQPRRFNAINLCNRVSKERGQSVGMEVGYSLGQGDVCVSPGTRIEFMTHGLFINRAMNPEKLLKSYCAVVLDEAHQRSVDVDFCFALLRKALQYSTAQRASAGADATRYSFKVLVASATVSVTQQALFEQFLSGSYPSEQKLKLPRGIKAAATDITSCVHNVGGNSFPVQVIYRADAEPDWTKANSIETTQALAAYAVEFAINIIRSGESEGNILVFLPGESAITRCMDVFSTWSTNKAEDLEEDSQVVSSTAVSTAKAPVVAAGADTLSAATYSASTDFTIRLDIPAPAVGVGKGKKVTTKEISVGVYPFHGKVSETLRKKMELHKGQDRIIIFTTNVAETGLTLPNIRYVIDTGLERRVMWNNNTCMQEMRTVMITQSSMNQRSGRAGRVASGVCVRLYSKATADAMELAPKPDIESGSILKAVLNLRVIAEAVTAATGGNSSDSALELMTEIPAEGMENAIQMLQQLGALNVQDNSVTAMGHQLIKLGLHLPVGRFVLACHSSECLGSGADIAAIVTTNNYQSLLPVRFRLKSYPQEFIDPSGDHLTLLNVFSAYEASKSRATFCVKYNFDPTVLDSIMRTRDHLQNIFLGMKIVATDSRAVAADPVLRRRKILESLCASYFDCLLSANSPGKCANKFVRVLTPGVARAHRHAAHDSAKSAGLVSQDDIDDDDGSVSSLSTSVSSDDQDSTVQRLSADNAVSIGHSSALWALDDQLVGANSTAGQQQQLAVFGSILLTDASRGPTAQLLSYVDQSHVQNGAQVWCNQTNFTSLVMDLAIQKRAFPISDALYQHLVQQKGEVLKTRFKRFTGVDATCIKADKTARTSAQIVLSAPKYAMAHIERELRRMDENNKGETAQIEFGGLDNKQTGAIINVFGRGKNKEAVKIQFVANLNHMLQNSMGGSMAFTKISPNDIAADGQQKPGSCIVSVSLGGPSKQMMSSVIAVIQSEVAHILQRDLPIYPKVLSNSAADNAGSGNKLSGSGGSDEQLHSARLTQMSTSVSPPSSTSCDRATAMVFMAHAAVWKARCSVYGGFIRDFIINGVEAKDVDIGYETTTTTRDALREVIMTAAASLGLRKVKEGPEGKAHTLVFERTGLSKFKVDLVDMAQVRREASAPGVDCDVGNLVMKVSAQDNNSFGLQLKVDKPSLVSASESQRHCQKKQFVFYYQLDSTDSTHNGMAQVRLQKYLEKGWVCLTQLPAQTVAWANGAGFGAQLQPKNKYSVPYHQVAY